MSKKRSKKEIPLFAVTRYKNEAIASLVFLALIFRYILEDTQEVLTFSNIGHVWGMWCRVFFSTTNVFWFGASYWLVFGVWIREIMHRGTSRMMMVRYGSKRRWSFGVLKNSICFAVLFPFFHFLWLCLVNVFLYGWNHPEMETEAFKAIFLNVPFSMAVVTSLLVRILVSVLGVFVIWLLVLLSGRVLYSVAGYMLYALLSCIAVNYDIGAYAAVFPAGASFVYLLRDYAENLVLILEIFVAGTAVFCLLQKFFLQRTEMEKMINKNG